LSHRTSRGRPWHCRLPPRFSIPATVFCLLGAFFLVKPEVMTVLLSIVPGGSSLYYFPARIRRLRPTTPWFCLPIRSSLFREPIKNYAPLTPPLPSPFLPSPLFCFLRSIPSFLLSLLSFYGVIAYHISVDFSVPPKASTGHIPIPKGNASSFMRRSTPLSRASESRIGSQSGRPDLGFLRPFEFFPLD